MHLVLMYTVCYVKISYTHYRHAKGMTYNAILVDLTGQMTFIHM